MTNVPDGWEYMAARLIGDGTIEVIETELDINITAINQQLSAPSTMTGTIDNEIKRLKKNGRPVFEPWNTVILAVASDEIRGMTVYQKPTFNGPQWTLNQIGLSGYPIDMPYDGSKYFIAEDPTNIFRHIWEHLQSFPMGNLGITVDPLTTPVRVGTQLEEVEFVTGSGELVQFEAGPRKLNWWQTANLGAEIDSYAKETPFDWVEHNYWNGDQPRCHIKLGHPQIGTRKEGLRLVLGENLATEPSVSQADYVNQVHTLGAGEGRDRIRGYAGTTDGRIRRARSVDDKTKKSVKQANDLASSVLASSRGELVVDTVEVHEHPNAPLRSIVLGDSLLLYAEMDHVTVDQHVRVVGKVEAPGKNDVAVLTVVRSAVI